MRDKSMTSYDVSPRAAPPRYALTQFTVEEFQTFWPHIEEMLDQIPHTWRYWTKEYIYGSIVNGHMQVWGIGRPPKATFIMFTVINVCPAMRVLVVVWAAGAFEDEMLPLLEATFANFGRLNGCDEVEIRGRMGWEPKLKSLGFVRSASIWTRKIPSVQVN